MLDPWLTCIRPVLGLNKLGHLLRDDSLQSGPREATDP